MDPPGKGKQRQSPGWTGGWVGMGTEGNRLQGGQRRTVLREETVKGGFKDSGRSLMQRKLPQGWP